MIKFTLKTFKNTKLIERFEHRVPYKISRILNHPRHHRAGEDPFGNELNDVANRFEVYDSMNEKIFDGNVTEALNFVDTL